MRRVSYHQSVFDLIDLQPASSPEAAEMIRTCEERLGQKLPEAVRQWYLIEIEHFHEDARQEMTEGVMQYRFHGDQGRIRVTTDDYQQGGVSAWWLHADSEVGLSQLASQVQGWCGLRQKLRHFHKAARPVLDRLRSET